MDWFYGLRGVAGFSICLDLAADAAGVGTVMADSMSARECEFTHDCPFHREYGQRKSNVWLAVINMYCRGASKELCHSYTQRKTSGVFDSAQIMPTGRPVTIAFRMLP